MISTGGNSFINGMGSIARGNIATAEVESLQREIKLTGDEKKRQQALQEYEGMFIAQMLKLMFNSIPVDENFGGGFAEETFRDFLTDEYGKLVSKAGGVGIANDLQKSLFDFQNIDSDVSNILTSADKASKAYSKLT